jgi:hypothetical protein
MDKLPESAPVELKNPGAVTVSAQLRGDTVSYALQHMVSNLAANIYEPWIDSRVQKKYYDHFKNGTHGYGSYKQNFIGQIAGDVGGGAALITAELLIPNQLHTFTRAARKAIDPVYECFAHWALADQKQAPDYAEQVERWKTYQERSIVRSAVMMTAAMGTNIATQKAIGNPSPVKAIFGSRVVSMAVTTAITLVSRLLFPEQTRKFDKWVNNKVVQPLFADELDSPGTAYSDKILKEKQKNAQSLSR